MRAFLIFEMGLQSLNGVVVLNNVNETVMGGIEHYPISFLLNLATIFNIFNFFSHSKLTLKMS